MKNRIIKFRTWCSPKMSYYSSGIIGFEQIRAKALDGLANDKYLMQFTGLKDKNGVEIYEGDIISFVSKGTDHAYEVQWYEYQAGHWGWWPNSLESHRVIGNIYENPELMSHKQQLAK